MGLRETVVAQTAELFGKLRPAAGLQTEEAEALAAERKAFVDELLKLLKKVRFPPDRVERSVRDVFHEVKSQPYTIKVPQPYELYRRVDSRLTVGVTRPWCPVCELFGRRLVWSDGTPHPQGKSRGEIEMSDGSWWCQQHLSIAVWYASRQQYHFDGKAFTYPPPTVAVPRDCWRPGAHGVAYLEWTDGAFMTPEVEYVRSYVEKAIGEQLLTESVVRDDG